MVRHVTPSSARVKSETTNGVRFELGHPFVGVAGRSSDTETFSTGSLASFPSPGLPQLYVAISVLLINKY